ncbi:MAG: CBS domain-containing protein [Desulfobacterales bacterium]|jgi:acetoin utilization protein AcuB
MLVKKWMSENLITIRPYESAIKASMLLRDNHIKHLPVIEKDKLVGIVTDSDMLRVSTPSDTLRVEHVMTKNPVTVPWNYTIGEAAETLLKHNISGAPVVGVNGKVVGIITEGDLFKILVPLAGVGEKGIQLALFVADRPGSIKEITDIIRAYGGRMMSILTSYDNAPRGYLRVILRLHGIDRDRFQKMRQIIANKASLLYWVDHRNNMRDIYRVE